MNISSMTGFGRSNGQYQTGNMVIDWAFEMKSVNGKNFDFKVKLPPMLEFIGSDLRNIAQKYFERGTVNVNLDIKNESDDVEFKINNDFLARLVETSVAFGEKNHLEPPTMGELLNISGVIEVEKKTLNDEENTALCAELLQGFEKCCIELQKDRRREGEKIAAVLQNLLGKIKDIVAQIAATAEDFPQRIADKLRRQIADFLGENAGVSEERLAQEIVFLVNRADIREEIDRLRTHVKTAEELLQSGNSVGRRLDFLCQELNREANTTCSKAADVEIVNCGMELKATIEQLREQVQNME